MIVKQVTLEQHVQNVLWDIIKLVKSVSVSIFFKPKLSPGSYCSCVVRPSIEQGVK